MPVHQSLTSTTEFRFDLAHLRSLMDFRGASDEYIQMHFFYELEDVMPGPASEIQGDFLVVRVPTRYVPRAWSVFKAAKIWH